MEPENTYEQEIDLKDLMFAVLYKWRPIIITAVIVAVLLGGFKGMRSFQCYRDADAQAEAQESYQQDLEVYNTSKSAYEREIDNITNDIQKQQEYLESSILMNVSPYDVCEARADLFIRTDYEIMPGMMYQNVDYTDTIIQAYQSLLTSNAFLGKVAAKAGLEQQYLQELISVERGSMSSDDETFSRFTNLLTIRVKHADQRQAEDILELLLSRVEELHEQVAASIGEHSVSVVNRAAGAMVDLELADQQKDAGDQVTKLQSSLADKEKALKELKEPAKTVLSRGTVVKQAVKYAVLGGVLGGFMAVFFVCVMFLMSDKLYAAKEMRRRYDLHVLGSFAATGAKKAGVIDRWLNRLEGRKPAVSAEQSYALLAANIGNYAADGAKILLTGTTAESESLKDLAANLQQYLPDQELVYGGNMLEHAETVKLLPECDSVVLVEQIGKSVYSAMEQEVEKIRSLQKNMAGCIVIE